MEPCALTLSNMYFQHTAFPTLTCIDLSVRKLFMKLKTLHVKPRFFNTGGSSKIARVRAYYLYCMWLAVLTSLQILTVTKY